MHAKIEAGASAVGALACAPDYLKVSDVFVVRRYLGQRVELRPSVRSLNHLYAITLRIVLNFVHDVVDEEHSAAGRSEKIGGIARIGNLANVEAFAFVFDSESSLLWLTVPR